MATPRTIVSEIFYHKTSAMRFELGSYRDTAKLKIEIVPQAKDANGTPIEKKFDYEKKLSMVFGYGEALRIKRMVEQTLNPQRQVPKDGYIIEHFFEAGTPPEKKKSALIFKRVDNLVKNNSAMWEKDPYQFPFTIAATLYSSLHNTSYSFLLSEEEAYWIINMMPYYAWAFMKENQRINDENRAARATGNVPQNTGYTRSQHRAEAPGAVADSDQGSPFEGMNVSTKKPDTPSAPPAFSTDVDFTDFPI